MSISTQNIQCLQCQMNTCHTSFRERERQRQRQRDRVKFSIKKSFELWERTAVSDQWDQEGCSRQGETEVLKFSSCTRKSCFFVCFVFCFVLFFPPPIWTGTESARRSVYRETWWQVWWQLACHQRNRKQRWLSWKESFLWLVARHDNISSFHKQAGNHLYR